MKQASDASMQWRLREFCEWRDTDADFHYMKGLITTESSGKLELRNHATKGRYVVAATSLRRGDVILTTSKVSFQETSDLGLALLLPQIFERLPDMCRLQPRASGTQTDAAVLTSLFVFPYVAMAVSIVRNNCFDAGVDVDGSRTMTLSVAGSMFQHSCKMNACQYNVEDREVFVCTQDVRAGEELFVTYGLCSKLEPWGFECAETLHTINFQQSKTHWERTVEVVPELKSICARNVIIPTIDTFRRFYDAVELVTRFADRANVEMFGNKMMRVLGRPAPHVIKPCASCSAPAALTCSRCKSAVYCSTACQRLHRRDHRASCDPWPLLHSIILDPHSRILAKPS